MFTYDPDLSIKTHLGWIWSCDYNGNTTDLNIGHTLLDSTDSDNIQMDFALFTLQYSKSYIFTVNMKVYDTTNVYRDSCNDSIVITVNTMDYINNDNNITKSKTDYIIQTAPLNTNINKEDILRIDVSVLICTDYWRNNRI